MPVSGSFRKERLLGGKYCRRGVGWCAGTAWPWRRTANQINGSHRSLISFGNPKVWVFQCEAPCLSSLVINPWLCEDKPVTFSWNSTERSGLLSSAAAAIYPQLVFVGSPTQPFPEMTVLFLTLLWQNKQDIFAQTPQGKTKTGREIRHTEAFNIKSSVF